MQYSRFFPRIIIPAVFIASFLFAIHGDRREDTSNLDRVADERQEMAALLEGMRWYNFQRAYPAGTIPSEWREKAMQKIQQNALRKTGDIGSLTWKSIGPATIGGRTRAIVVDPHNSSIIYAGSVSGGIWKSTDAGSSWTALTDFMPNLIIGCLAIDPNNSSIVYAGTGEGYFSYDAFRGSGVLKSTDAGATWTLLNSFTGYSSFRCDYLNKIIVRPDNSSTLYAAVIGTVSPGTGSAYQASSVFKSTNAGVSWSKLSVGNRNGTTSCVDLVEDPVTYNTLYASFGQNVGDGIYKSTNGGTNWAKTTSATNGYPASGFARASIAIAKTTPTTLYACISDSQFTGTKAMVKTTNGGATWTPIAIPYDPSQLVRATHLAYQGWYNNVIAVDPKNANVVYTGGINMFKSTNGGTTFSPISDGYGGATPYMHVDHHAIVFDPANSSIVYFGNDGGVWKTTNSGASFVDCNKGYVTTQFYSCASHPYLDIRIGGTQDNGTLRGNAATPWTTIFGGDGGYTAIDSVSPTTYYSELFNLGLLKSTQSGASGTWSLAMGVAPNNIPTNTQQNGTTDRCAWIAPFIMDPGNSQRLIAGTFRLYQTTNGGVSWSKISNDITGDGDGSGDVGSYGSVVSAIAIARTAPNTVYAGTSGSSTIRSKLMYNDNVSNPYSLWSFIGSGLPNRYIASIAVDPGNAGRIYVGMQGYNDATLGAAGHVFLCANPTVGTWNNISGDLPDLPVNKLVLDPANVNHIIAGTDLGIFETRNGGTNWTQTPGFPNVPVLDLDVRKFDRIVVAGTHGRGMFVSDAPLSAGVEQTPAPLPVTFALGQNYPNPFNPATTVPFIVARQAHVRLSVYDVIGKEVATLVDKEMSPGSYRASFDGNRLASGVYFCRFSAQLAGGAPIEETRKMLLTR